MADNMCNVARTMKKAITYWFTGVLTEVRDLYLLVQIYTPKCIVAWGKEEYLVMCSCFFFAF